MMPTYSWLPGFLADHNALTPAERAAFARMRKKLVAGLKAGRPPRRGLRVRQLAGFPGVFEITWAPNGRATFSYGESVLPSELHIIWRHVGGHEIFDNP